MRHETSPAAFSVSAGDVGSLSTAQQQYEACLECLAGVDEWLGETPWSFRMRAAMVRQLHHLLQYLTIATTTTIRTVHRQTIDAWLAHAVGLAAHDTRVALLNLLAQRLALSSLKTAYHPGSARWRRFRETWWWGAYQRELTGRTRTYFESITQDDILAAEQACVPFYEALHASSPRRDFSGVFVESDKVILGRIAALSRAQTPSIVDIGCGRGRLLTTLRQRFTDARLIGTSIFPFTTDEKAQLAATQIEPLYCTAQRIDLPDASQDIVVSSEVIEHLRHPEDLIDEILRVLKPDGVFCVTAPSRASYLYGPNPLSYLMVALGAVVPSVLPTFHNLYAPLTPIPIVHYGFDPADLRDRFRIRFPTAEVTTTRFTALEKFRLARLAPRLPVLRKMGGLCVASGRKT